jgi:hypothetical protein
MPLPAVNQVWIFAACREAADEKWAPIVVRTAKKRIKIKIAVSKFRYDFQLSALIIKYYIKVLVINWLILFISKLYLKIDLNLI